MASIISHTERWRRLGEESFLIVGFTELTGLSAARLLAEHGVPYAISDSKPRVELAPVLAQLAGEPERIHTGPQTVDQLEGVTQILLSPGVPRAIPLIRDFVLRHGQEAAT